MAAKTVTTRNGKFSVNLPEDAINNDTIIIKDDEIYQMQNGRLVRVDPASNEYFRLSRSLYESMLKRIETNEKDIAKNRQGIVRNEERLADLTPKVKDLEERIYAASIRMAYIDKTLTDTEERLTTSMDAFQQRIDSIIQNALNDIYELIRKNVHSTELIESYNRELQYIVTDIGSIKGRAADAAELAQQAAEDAAAVTSVDRIASDAEAEEMLNDVFPKT